MKYLKRFNESINKLTTNVDVKPGEFYNEADIYGYVQRIHMNYDDFIDGDIGDRIEEYENYKVEDVKISDIEIDEFSLDEGIVDEYKELFKESNKYPPIVLDSEYGIIDGTHRVNALNDIGIEYVRAFVGQD